MPLKSTPRNWSGYLIAFLATAAAAACRIALHPFLGDTMPFLLFPVAVTVGTRVAVAVGVAVRVAVTVAVRVGVVVATTAGVLVIVGVAVRVGSGVAVSVGVAVCVGVGVAQVKALQVALQQLPAGPACALSHASPFCTVPSPQTGQFG